MADLNFPSNPQVGDTYTIGTRTWVWNGNAWQIQSSITSLDPFTAVRGIFTTSTVAVTTASGALQVRGGIGIGGNIVQGRGATTRNKSANIYSGGVFAVEGDAQVGFYILRREISSATATPLTLNGLGATIDNQIILPSNSAFSFKILVTAKASTTNNEGAWEFNGIISKGALTGSVSVKVVNKTKIWSSIAGYNVDVIADTVNGGLQIVANAADTNPVRFLAKVETVEITI